MLRASTISLLAILLSGCATGYHPKGLGGGYSETALSPRIYSVSFNGNGYTGSSRSADLALLRAAELTVQSGFTHFSVMDKSAASSITSASSVTMGGGHGGSYTSTTMVSKPSSDMTIFMMGEDAHDLAYDANFLIKSLADKYGVKRLQETE